MVIAGITDRAAAEIDPQLADLFDVICSDPRPLASSVERWPLASVTLAVVLRATSRLDVATALTVESAAYSMLQAGPEFARWRVEHPPRPAEPEQEPVVLVRREGASFTITLNRPARHNALNAAMRDQLHEALLIPAADAAIERVVLDGAGPSFCSGGDLDEFGTRPDPPTAHVIRLARSAGAVLSGLGAAVEARLHGACMGAGIELPAFASRVVADPGSIIALPEIAMGLIPGAGGTVSLVRRIGRHRTAELALTRMQLDAPTALTWGLIDEVGPLEPATVP